VKDIDIYRLASELVVDAVVPGNELREELERRLEMYSGKQEDFSKPKHPVYPV